MEGPELMQHTAEADRGGVMLALVPSHTASKALLQHSGGTEPLDDQHITLAYLGTLGEEVPDDPETRRKIEAIVRTQAARYAALNGEANGWGVFHNDDDVVVALWNIPGVNGLRQALIDDLRQAGVPAKGNFSYTPHQTMGYYEAAEQVAAPKRLPFPVRSDFRSIMLTWGGEQAFIPLTGLLHESRSPSGKRDYTRRGNPDNPGQFSKQDLGYDKDSKPNKGRSSGPQSGTSTTQQAQEDPQAQQDAQEPQEAQEGQEKAQQAAPAGQEEPQVEIPPGDDYTGTSYAAISERTESLSDEDKRAVGDLYLAPLPAGKYPEGDPRNEPDCERVMAEKEALVKKHIQGPLPGMHKDKVDEPWYDPANAEIIKAWRESGTGGQTRDLHDRRFDAASGRRNVYSPERSREHQEILRRYEERYEGYPREGKAIVMAGPPGAGKSTFLDNYGEEHFGVQVTPKEERKAGANPAKNFVTINPDDFKDFITVDPARYPGLNENELAAIKHEESSFLAKQATEYFMHQGYNVIIDITLGSSASAMKKYYTPYEDKYDFQVALVDGDMKNSRNNAGLRFKAPDKATGKRTYSGRFIPMDVIEANAPDKPGWRSKNAQEFAVFTKNPKVSKAIVYDPYSKVVEPATAAFRGEEQQEQEQRAASSSMGVRGRVRSRKEATMAELRKVASTSYETTEVTAEIEKYHRAEITEDALITWLVEHDYAAQEENPHEPGTPEWWQAVEDDGYTPGTWDEVLLARNRGLLTWETFHKVNDALNATLG